MYSFFVITACREEWEPLVGVYRSVRCGHETHAASCTAQHVKNHTVKKALKRIKIASITTQYNNIYVIILQLVEN